MKLLLTALCLCTFLYTFESCKKSDNTDLNPSLSFVTIADANFEQTLIDQKIDTDGKLDGQIKSQDALNATKLDLNGSNKPTTKAIKDLTGIENFKNLRTLDCSNNALSSLDVSKNLSLVDLRCSNNNLSNLNVSKNLALSIFHCVGNNLSELDLSKNIALTVLVCSKNHLSTLDISKNTALNILLCDSNKLSTLNVSYNLALSDLYCDFNNLSTLDIQYNIKLYYFSCTNNPLLQTICVSNLAIAQLAQSYNNWKKDNLATYITCN
ncbi:hypothetical protein [Emticicia sp. SJ17W-69]|uniref:hypothetical protein n=1 Tax=Emticicia sp. SJ17W-69 TaxID=3421657 RepID=UPI003EB8C7F5